MIELTEKHIVAIITGGIHSEALPEDFLNFVNFYTEQNPPGLDEFLFENGEFQTERAAIRMIIAAKDVNPSQSYWYTRNTSRYRYNGFDGTLDLAEKHGSLIHLLTIIVKGKKTYGRVSKCCRHGILGWLIEHDKHKDKEIVKLILTGYFDPESKVQLMERMIEDGMLKEIEIFWNSRARDVRAKLVEIAPLEDLPFLLTTDDPYLLDLICNRMSNLKQKAT